MGINVHKHLENMWLEKALKGLYSQVLPLPLSLSNSASFSNLYYFFQSLVGLFKDIQKQANPENFILIVILNISADSIRNAVKHWGDIRYRTFLVLVNLLSRSNFSLFLVRLFKDIQKQANPENFILIVILNISAGSIRIRNAVKHWGDIRYRTFLVFCLNPAFQI